MTSKVKGQGRDVTWCVWQVLAHSRTQSPRNTEIGSEVAYLMGNIAHLFQGQRDKGQGQQEDRKCIISTKREGIRTSKLVRRWSMLSVACTASYSLKALWSWVARGRGHTVSVEPGGHTTCYSYFVPDWIDDREVALECNNEYVVGGRVHRSPERSSREPNATNELVIVAVAWHTSAVHLDDSEQQRQERRTHVYDALVDNQNVYRLNKQQQRHSL